MKPKAAQRTSNSPQFKNNLFKAQSTGNFLQADEITEMFMARAK